MDDIRQYKASVPASKVDKYSVFKNNSWRFMSLDSLTFTKLSDSIEYAKPASRFAVLYSVETDPRKVFSEGVIGDYLLRDSEGCLSIVKKADFDKKY